MGGQHGLPQQRPKQKHGLRALECGLGPGRARSGQPRPQAGPKRYVRIPNPGPCQRGLIWKRVLADVIQVTVKMTSSWTILAAGVPAGRDTCGERRPCDGVAGTDSGAATPRQGPHGSCRSRSSPPGAFRGALPAPGSPECTVVFGRGSPGQPWPLDMAAGPRTHVRPWPWHG